MNKEQFNNLSLDEQLKYVNEQLTIDNNSFTFVCESLIGIRRNTVRDRFKRYGYVLDSDSKQFKGGEFPTVAPTKEPVEKKAAKTKHKTNNDDLESIIKRLDHLEKIVNNTSSAKKNNKGFTSCDMESNGVHRNYKLYPSVINALDKVVSENSHLTTTHIINSLLKMALDELE